MPRPAKHTTDDLLDAAAELFADGGIEAVTMSGVAARAGATNGSVYHRFATRGELLGKLWLRTIERYHDVVVPIAERNDALGAALSTVAWCAANLGDARVLVAGAQVFDPASWPEPVAAAVGRANRAFGRCLDALVTALADRHGLDRAVVVFAIVDLPYSAVRRHLEGGAAPPASVAAALERAITAALSPEIHPDVPSRT